MSDRYHGREGSPGRPLGQCGSITRWQISRSCLCGEKPREPDTAEEQLWRVRERRGMVTTQSIALAPTKERDSAIISLCACVVVPAWLRHRRVSVPHMAARLRRGMIVNDNRCVKATNIQSGTRRASRFPSDRSDTRLAARGSVSHAWTFSEKQRLWCLPEGKTFRFERRSCTRVFRH